MKKNISIVGLGFIGLPMLINLATLKSKNLNKYKYDVIGLEKDNFYGVNKKKKILLNWEQWNFKYFSHL